jgi:hypothetical protein
MPSPSRGVSGGENPRNSGRQETRSEQNGDRREIMMSSGEIVSKPMAFKIKRLFGEKEK